MKPGESHALPSSGVRVREKYSENREKPLYLKTSAAPQMTVLRSVAFVDPWRSLCSNSPSMASSGLSPDSKSGSRYLTSPNGW